MSCNCTSPAPTHSCAPGTTGLERVNYFPRQIMTVEDMVTEAEYFREKLRRHNRYLHGWGVVCGLDVTASGTAAAPATVSIGSGYALGPNGDEIFVADPVTLDLSRCGPDAATDPCEPDLLHSRPGVGNTVFVAIKYSQCLAKPVRAMPAGCACDELDCEYSRVRDSFEISCLDHVPAPPPIPWLCDFIHGSGPLTCPPTPIEPWVVLARVTLPSGENAMNIDYSVRRYIFSTAVIQEQLIKCCCNGDQHIPPPPPTKRPATVLKIDPQDGSQFNTGPSTLPLPPSQISITFDKSLISDTVKREGAIQVTVAVAGGAMPSNVKGTVTYDDSTRSAVFKPDSPFAGATIGARYDVTVRGIPPDAILDIDNLQLDGKGLGIPSNFTSSFTVFAPIM